MARLSTTTRFSLFYLLHYAVMGIHLPGMQLWYQAQGVTPTQLGALGFVTILARVLTGPLFGSWVDRNGHARAVCAALNWLTLFVFALNLLGGGYWVLLAIAIAYTILRSPSGPLGDALAVAAGRHEPVDFGRVRFWGSASFMALAIAGGPLVDRLGVESIPWLCLALFLVAVVGTHCLPADIDAARTARPQAPVRFLLRQPVVLVFLATASFAQASHAVLYAFSTLHWNAVGLNQSEIGWLWGVSTAVELVLLWYSRHAIARLSPTTMLLLGGLSAVPRWGVPRLRHRVLELRGDPVPACRHLRIHLSRRGAFHRPPPAGQPRRVGAIAQCRRKRPHDRDRDVGTGSGLCRKRRPRLSGDGRVRGDLGGVLPRPVPSPATHRPGRVTGAGGQ